MRKKRTFSAELKAQLVLEVLSGLKTQSEVAREHGLKAELISRWRAEALARLPEVFRRPDAADPELARVAELERTVGRLTLQLEAAKKLSRWLQAPSANDAP